MKTTLLLTLFLLPITATLIAQPSVRPLHQYMAAVRQGSYAPAPAAIFQDESNASTLINAAATYTTDSVSRIRSKAYNIVKQIALNSRSVNARQKAVGLLIDGISDADTGLSGNASESLHRFDKTDFTDDAQDGIDDGESWNPSGYACNNAVRAFLYHHKSDAILFPETMPSKADDFRYGSGLAGPNDATVLKGEISWDGTADKMWDDFDGDGNDLTGSFTEIAKNSTETWNAYFDRLQKEANKGTVIVGVVHSDNRAASRGHVVALIPESLCESDQRILEDWKE